MHYNPYSVLPPTPSFDAIIDSGCTGHYFPTINPLINITPTTHGLPVTLPDSTIITSSHTGSLQIPTLPPQAQKAYIFPELTSSALLSVGQLCDSDCTVIFNKNNMLVKNNNGQEILSGNRDLHSGLWKVPLSSTTLSSTSANQANGIIKRDTPISDLCEFLHAALFSPAQSTFEKAFTNGFLDSFPGLTLKTIRKYLPLSESTTKGHLDQEKWGIMPSNKDEPRTMNFMVNAFKLPTGKSFSDQTG